VLLLTLLLLSGSSQVDGVLMGQVGQAAPPPGVVIPDPEVFQESQPFDDPAVEATVRRLATELRCPTCQALSIEDSPSELSQQMKSVIRDRLREGMTPEEVKAHFVAAYGEWILLSPTPSGFNLLVYVLPFAALLLGGVVLVVAMRSWMAPGGTPAAAESEAGVSARGEPPPAAG
jgi:cytochrome c-type biogenesis protein CcmH